MTFKITNQDKNARTGILKTKTGSYETPFFMPVATKGAPKYIEASEIKELDGYAMISNAFLLYLKPGLKVIKKNKGIQKLMNWSGCSFTDSGGFQVLSLNKFKDKFSDEGLVFKSPYDGSIHKLNPKTVMKIEEEIGSDVAMAIDQMPLYGQTKDEVKIATERTHKWAIECLKTHKDSKQLLFGICQGGVFPDLRKESAEFFSKLNFDGYGIGGLAVGEPKEKMKKMVKIATETLPKNKPRYLMGVGSPKEIIECVELGVDIFDSVWPTRIARHGKVMTKNGSYNINKKEFELDLKPLDKSCNCKVCKNYTKSYLHHLYKVKEPLAMKLLSYHNLAFIQNLMKEIRTSIKNKKFNELKKKYKKV
jgi:queuine tRNA-ribosyltransferase